MITETIDMLGLRAKDKVTGYVGTISSVSFDLYGCVQLALTPDVSADGKLEGGHWFDVHRVDVQKKRVMPVPNFAAAAVQPKDFKHGPAEKPAPSTI